MKKLTTLLLAGIMGLIPVKLMLAQEIIHGNTLSKTATLSSRGIKSVNTIQTKGTILDSMQLLQTRSPLGVTVVNDTIVISSSDGKGNNYFDTYNFSGKHLNSTKQPGTTKWGYRDLAFDGQYILASEDTNIQKVSPHTFAVVSSISNKGNSIHRGLAYDPGEKAIYSTNLSGSHLLKINAATGKTIKDYGQLPSYRNPYGLAFDPYSMPGMASLWYSTPASFNHFWLTRVDTVMGEANFIYDYSDQLPDSCYVGGLEIVNNVAKYTQKVVALELDQYRKKLYFMDITPTPNNLPTGMEQVGTYDGSNDVVTNITTGFVIYDKYLYAVRNNKLAIYQIDTDPAHPKLLKNIDVSFPNKIFLHGKNLFLSTGDKEVENTTGLTIFSLEDPLNPALKSTVNTGGHVLGMTFVGKYAFLAQRGDVKMKSLDISDLSHLAFSTEYTLPYGGWAIASDTAAKLVFVSFTKYEGSNVNGYYVLNVSGMPATINKIYDYRSNYAYASFVTIDGKVLAALGNDAQNKVSYVGFWHYTSTACTQEPNDYFTVCDTATADHMGLIGGTTILVSVPGEKLLQTYAYDTEMKKRFTGPTLKQEVPTDFIWYTPSGKKDARLPSIDNTSDFRSDTYVYTTNGTRMGGVNWGSEKVTVTKLKAPPKTASKVTLVMKIKPSQAQFDGCTTEPSVGSHQYDLHTVNPVTPSLIAHDKPDKGWYFKEWTGDASGTTPATVVQMDGNKTVTANFVNLSLYIHGSQAKQIICPDSIKKWQLQMLPISLTASDDDDWVVTAVKIKTSGNGNEKTDIQKAFLFKGDNELGNATFSSDNEKLSINLDNGLNIPAGQTVNIMLRYHFKIDTLHYASDFVRTFLVSTNGVTAKPKHYEAGWISGAANADTLFVARVINKNKSRGFAKIQEAISSPVTKDGDTIWVCPGSYYENLKFNKSLNLISLQGRDKTKLLGNNENAPGFYGYFILINKSNVTINGFSILKGQLGFRGGIRISNGSDSKGTIVVKNNVFSGMEEAIYFGEGANLLVDNNLFQYKVSLIGFQAYKDSVRRFDTVRLTRNWFHGTSSWAGLRLAAANCFIFDHNQFMDSVKIVASYIDSMSFDHNISLSNANSVLEHGEYSNKLNFSYNSYVDVVATKKVSATIENNKHLNISLDGGGENNISNNLFNISEKGLDISNSTGENIIKGNTFLHSGGLKISHSSNDKIENNIFSQNKATAITLDNASGESIHNNQVANNEKEGLLILVSKHCKIQKNIIKYNKEDGVKVDLCSHILISANRIDRNKFGVTIFNNGLTSIVYNNVLIGNCTGLNVRSASNVKLKGNYILNSFCLNTGIHLENSSPEISGNLIKNNHGYGISANRGSQPVLRTNNVIDNSAGGLINKDASVKIDAQNNWWGADSGPAGTDVSGNVDASGWQTEASGLESAVEEPKVYAVPGKTDSAYIFYTNLQNAAVSMNFTLSDDKGWMQMPASLSRSAKDSLGIALPVKYRVPTGTADGAVDRIIVQASSKTKESSSFTDTILIYAYIPVLQQVSISPDSLTIIKNDTATFYATGYDQHEKSMEFAPSWQASAGKVDSTGKFIPGSATGVVTLTATDKNHAVSGSTKVYIADKTPELKRIAISPDTMTLKPGESWSFSAKGFNQYDFPADLALQWTAKGGTIDQSGYYQADSTSGTFLVTARDTVADISQTAVVIIENTTGIATPAMANQGLVLSQNVPNPFRIKTQISFTLTRAATVWLRVFDMNGREVARLVNAKKQAGHHTVIFQTSGLPAGIYFYRLQAGGMVKTKKMIIMKQTR